MSVGAAVALDADGANVCEEYDGALPYLVVEACVGQFRAGDEVSSAEGFEALFSDFADDADAEARPGEGLAVDDFFGEA